MLYFSTGPEIPENDCIPRQFLVYFIESVGEGESGMDRLTLRSAVPAFPSLFVVVPDLRGTAVSAAMPLFLGQTKRRSLYE